MTRLVRIISLTAALAVLGVIGWYLYAPALRAPFFFDDIDNIVANPHVRMTAITLDSLAGILQNRLGNRPLANASFAFNYFFHQYDPVGYHIINICIHLVTAGLVFIIAGLTLSLCGAKNTRTPLLAAALWLVNPVHTQSVTYIVQRMNALAAMFVLLSLAFYIQARRIQTGGQTGIKPVLFFSGAGLSGLFGLMSKETAAILPVIIFLFEWYFFQNLDRAWFKKQLLRISLAVVALIVVGLICTNGGPVEKLLKMYEGQDFTLTQRLLTQPVVILYYLTLLFFPHPARLTLDYNFPLSRTLVNPAATLPAIMALAALIVAAVYTAKKQRLLSFTILWFLAALAIESSFIGLAIIFEHRTYLPSVFPAILITYLLISRIRPALLLPVPAIITAIIICGLWTWQRNLVWADAITLWRDSQAKTPDSARILNNLGMAYKEVGDTGAASQSFRKALVHDPEMVDAMNNLGTILLDEGRFDDALTLFEKAIRTEPLYSDAYYNQGLTLMKTGKTIPAAQAFEEALRLNPFHEKAHNNLGVALMYQAEPDQAIACFDRTLALNPGFKEAYSNMGIAFYKKGMKDKAMECFNRAMDIDPFYYEAYNNLKRVKAQAEKYGGDIERLKQSLERNPDNARLSFLLAETYRDAGMIHLAFRQYEKTLSLQPDAVECLSSLGNLYAAHFQYQRAEEMFERLATLLPESPKIHYNLACIYALRNRPEKAVAGLKKAIDHGYDNWAQIASDKDLENIRDTEYFKKIITNLQAEKGE